MLVLEVVCSIKKNVISRRDEKSMGARKMNLSWERMQNMKGEFHWSIIFDIWWTTKHLLMWYFACYCCPLIHIIMCWFGRMCTIFMFSFLNPKLVPLYLHRSFVQINLLAKLFNILKLHFLGLLNWPSLANLFVCSSKSQPP